MHGSYMQLINYGPQDLIISDYHYHYNYNNVNNVNYAPVINNIDMSKRIEGQVTRSEGLNRPVTRSEGLERQ